MKKFLKNFLLFLKLHRFSIFVSLILAILWETQMIKFHWIWIFCPFRIPWLLVVFVIIMGYKLTQMLKQKLKENWIWK